MSQQKAKNPIGWFEIYVEDMERAKKFYGTVFQVTFEQIGGLGTPGFEMFAFPNAMEQYGAGGALVKMPGMSAGKNSILVYFSCDDCAIEESRVVTNGGRIEKSKFSIGEHGFISLLIDTEGNMIGLHSMK